MKRIVIIGGGISGLTAAHHLIELNTEHDFEIVVLESAGRTGGVIRTIDRDGFLIEAGPDAFISEKPEALALVRRIGLEKHVIETNTNHRRSFIARGNRLIPVPEGFRASRSFTIPAISQIRDFQLDRKARMALDLVLPRRPDTNVDDDETLASFVRRRLGKEALDRMAQPMVGGIYTADPELLSLRATMPRFLEMERNRRSLILAMWKSRKNADAIGTSGARYSLFLSLDQGMQLLVDTLAARLPGDCVRLNTTVKSLAFDNLQKGWRIQTSTNEIIEADGVCIALPAHAAAHLLRDTDAVLSNQLDSIQYASTATVNLAYRRADILHQLDGFGFVVPFIERRSILACSFSSVKFAGRAPNGSVLLRAFVGGALQPEMFALDDEMIVEAVRKELRELLGVIEPPLFTHLEKWPRSMAQYHIGHLRKLDRIKTQLDGLKSLQLAGNAFGGAGIPDCVRSGESAAKQLIASLSVST